MSIEVIKPGLMTTIQDQGRQGHYHLGIPPSGAMDQISFRAANALLGNDDNAAVLECALMGPELRFQHDMCVAITGAQMQPKIDGVEQSLNQVLLIKKGQVLSFGFALAGARAYIAFAGGIDVPLALGSRSTYVLGALGGVEGRPLRAGDVLSIGEPNVQPVLDKQLPEILRTPLKKQYSLRVMLGIYSHRVKSESLQQFLSETWMVSSEADRIGYRLKGGSPLEFKPRTPPFGAGDDPSNIVDACYPIGSIQVPSGQEPIILHRDAVSGGGYMMVGAVISADMDLVGQMPPNTKVNFVEVTLEEALKARQARHECLRQIQKLKL
ncbi:biotin-dependent carboxyltransferase family protein [Hydromonas duriensis]|uniref:Allophanate hydrolase n=1 Tax=Hydromonas duriensis TaxID=1527608 RepID=A0A4R6Y8V8_9BURK|nr:biotin-dependent carboxyltransferase family protein [Hydromonas duriensis]TDR31853.1 allophanate hydrolase [Hydromonas duriensis]